MEQSIKDCIRSMFPQDLPHSTSEDTTNTPDLTKVHELILDGSKIREISSNDALLLAQFPNLVKLSCNRTGLTSLMGLPYLPSLKVLEVTDNHISNGLEIIAQRLPNLDHLELGGNLIQDFNEILHLRSLQNLEYLGLEFNPVADNPHYRQEIFTNLKQIKFLDDFDINGQECEHDEISESDSAEDTTLKDFYTKDYDDDESDDDYQVDDEEESDEEMVDEYDEDDDENMEDKEYTN